MEQHHIEQLELMPVRENRAQYLTRKYKSTYNTDIPRRSWHTSNERNPFKLTNRLLAYYVGKNFNDFFTDLSERCKHNDLLMQYKYYFERVLSFDYDKCGHYCKYYLDNEGIIRKKSRRSRKKRLKTETPQEWYERRDAHRKAMREKIEKEYQFQHKEENFKKTG